jgi:hypothetical protein
MGERRKKGHFCPKAPPFLPFSLRTPLLSSPFPKKPLSFISLGNQSLHHTKIFMNKPLSFLE